MGLIYGLIGERLQHSLSPQIHSYIYKELNLAAEYKLLEVPRGMLKNTINDLKQSTIKGINVTIPYKVEIMSYIDELSSEAQKIGSVNTIAFDNRLIGCNTDYYGFGALLNRECINTAGARAAVLGSGGAAKAVIQYLLDNGADEVVVVSRTPNDESKNYYNSNISIIPYSGLWKYKCMDIIVNCTPCGMHPNIDLCPIAESTLKNYKTAIDLIYNPRETLFVKYAREHKLRTANGLYMLVAQAAAAYKFWNGIDIDKLLIEKIYMHINML